MTAHADNPPQALTVYANGYRVPFTQSPITEEEHMLVQLRPLFETLEVEVNWEEQTGTILCSTARSELILTIGSTEARIDEKAVIMPVAPRIENGSVFIPLRFILEALGGTVEWDDSQHRADVITDPGYPVFLAVQRQDTEKVRELLEDSGSANFTDRNNGLRTLDAAIIDEDMELIALLLSYGADPNRSMASKGRNLKPLEYATTIGSPELVKLLLEYGADPGDASKSGTITDLAVSLQKKATDTIALKRGQAIVELLMTANKRIVERSQGDIVLVPFNVGGSYNISNNKGGHWGYFDSTGQLAIAPKFFTASPFSEGLAFAISKDLTQAGYIDQTGSFKFTFDFIPYFFYGDFRDGLALIGKDKKWGYIDSTGEFVIPPKYDWALPFSEGLASVWEGDLCGLINREGEVVLEPKYQHIYSFTNGLAWATGEQSGFINTKGEMVLAHDDLDSIPIGEFTGPYAPARFSDQLVGFIDTKGDTVLEPVFAYAGSFNDGLAAAAYEEKYGYIDHTGEIVIPMQFDYAYPFLNGKALVKQNDRFYFINKAGRRTEAGSYDFVDSIGQGTLLDQHTPFTKYANGMGVLHRGSRSFYLLPDGKLIEWSYSQ
ncbi:MAG: hypothetical protein K0R57_1163 [Paenibacillaceae bacterium]|nr:hypothetical protein [Paenibacillaceae bacterium]